MSPDAAHALASIQPDFRSGPGRASGFLVEPKHHYYRGTVQGAMLMTFADRALGMAAYDADDRQPQATVQLDVHQSSRR